MRMPGQSRSFNNNEARFHCPSNGTAHLRIGIRWIAIYCHTLHCESLVIYNYVNKPTFIMRQRFIDSNTDSRLLLNNAAQLLKVVFHLTWENKCY